MGGRWREAAVGRAMVLAGLLLLAWGVTEIIAFARSLAAAAPVLEGKAGMPGLPVMAIALMALGVLGTTRPGPGGRTPSWTTALFGVALATALLGVLLLMAGPPIVGIVARSHGYVRCESNAGVRGGVTRWAADERNCLGEKPSPGEAQSFIILDARDQLSGWTAIEEARATLPATARRQFAFTSLVSGAGSTFVIAFFGTCDEGGALTAHFDASARTRAAGHARCTSVPPY